MTWAKLRFEDDSLNENPEAVEWLRAVEEVLLAELPHPVFNISPEGEGMAKIERDAPAPRPTREGIDTWGEKEGGATRSVGTWEGTWAERSAPAQLAATAIHALVAERGAGVRIDTALTVGAIAECIDAAMAEERREASDEIERLRLPIVGSVLPRGDTP